MRRIAGIVLFLLLMAPAAALACPVCGVAGTQDNWQAYAAMSIMLSVLPFSVVGLIAFVAYRNRKAAQNDEAE